MDCLLARYREILAGGVVLGPEIAEIKARVVRYQFAL